MKDSVRRRFAFTLATNLVRAGLNFMTGMLIARWLEPARYGSLAFLLGTFVGIRQLLELGSSSAFFTFLSQRARSGQFIRLFWGWMLLQFLIPLLALGFLFPTQWIDVIWRGESRGLVLLAFVAVFMQYNLWPAVQQMGEAQRETVRVQGAGALVALVHFAAMMALWWLGRLGIYAVFLAIAVEYFLAATAVGLTLPARSAAPEAETARDILGMYLGYCWPLIPYAIFGFAHEFADRWLLQKHGGAVEQAYYAVGAQFGAIAMLATTSILRIFWKEIAEAYHQQNHERAGQLYRKVSRLLYFTGSVIAGFLIPWSEALLREILGAAYAGGATTLAVMFLYPVHQSMGQIGGTMLYATERTKELVIIGIAFIFLSMTATYFVLAPRTASIPGLGLAAEGLAWKMVIMQFIQVNVVAILIARIWKWRFDWFYQVGGLGGCLLLGWMAHYLSVSVLGSEAKLGLAMSLGVLIYLAALASLVMLWPTLTGLTRSELYANYREVVLRASAIFER